MIAHQSPAHESLNVAPNKLFLSMLPAFVGYARKALRNLPPEAREDALCEVVANTFVAFTRLVERGKKDLAYPTVLARYAVAQFHAGRRVSGSLNSKELYSALEQKKGDLRIVYIGTPREQRGGWKELLIDSHRMSVADLAALRVDFPAWLDTLPRRTRRIAEDLAMGERTRDVAKKNRLSPGRVSQLRRELEGSWKEFVGEA